MSKYYEMSSKHGKNIRKHRLVIAEHLGRELSSDELVHHKDGDKRNNRLENLEILSRSEHVKVHGPIGERRKKKVYQYNLAGQFICEWDSAVSIQRQLGFHRSNISKCCRGEIKRVYGHIWKFKGGDDRCWD